MSLIFDVDIDLDNVAEEDKDAALLIVGQENERRSALEPPDPALPTSPDVALLASYKTVWSLNICPDAHSSYVAQADTFTKAQLGAGYDAAPESVQDDVDALLEPFIPVP